jgi:hypothetical protein
MYHRNAIPLPLVCVTMLLMIFSCKQPDQPVTATTPADASGTQDGQARGPFDLRGQWISQAYLDDLTRTGSPRKAQEGSEEVFLILPDSLDGTAALHYNFHEVMDGLRIRLTDIGFTLSDPEGMRGTGPAYSLKKLDADRIALNDKPFGRIEVSMNDQIPRVLERVLFDGMYQLPNGQRVTFDQDGRVRGLAGFKLYRPQLDYFDAGLQVDQVALGTSPDDMKMYGFAFRKDKLTIYALKCKTFDKPSGQCVDVAFGEALYTLARHHAVE